MFLLFESSGKKRRGNMSLDLRVLEQEVKV